MGGHHDLALLAVDQGEAAQGEAIGPVGLRPVEAGGDRQDAALARVERQGAGVVPLAHPPGPGDVGDGAGRAGGEEAPAGAELGGPVLPLAQADGQRSRSQGDGPPLAPLRPNGLGFGPALDDAGEAVVTGDLEAGAAVGGAAVVDELDPDDAVGDGPAERSPSRRHGQCAPDYINGSTNSLEERPRSTARVDGINGQGSWRLEPPSESGPRRRASHPTPHHQLLFTTGILVVSPHAPDASRPSAGPSGRPAGGEGPGSRSARNAHPSTGPVVRSAGAGAGFP